MLCVSLTKKFRIIHSPRSFPAIIYNVGWGSGGGGGGGGGGGQGGGGCQARITNTEV